MNLNILLAETVGGFGVGFAAGIRIDRNIVFSYETSKCLTELAKEFAEKLSPANTSQADTIDENLEKAFQSQLSVVEKKTCYLTALMVGISNITAEVYKVAPFGTTLAGMSLTALATYAGIKLGEYYSRINRKKSKLTPEEKKKDDENFNAMIDSIKNSESDSEPYLYLNSLRGLAIRKRNVQIFRDVHMRMVDIVPGVLRYRAFRQFLELDEMEGGMFSKIINSDAEGDAELLILHDKKIHLYLPILTAEGLVVNKPQKFDWDESVEGLVGIAEQVGQKPLVMVKGKDAPLRLKELVGAVSCSQIAAKIKHAQTLH